MTEHKNQHPTLNKMHLLNGTEGCVAWSQLREGCYANDGKMYAAVTKRVLRFYKYGWFSMKHFVTYNINLNRDEQKKLLLRAKRKYPELFALKPRPYFSRGFFHDLCAALLQGEKLDEKAFEKVAERFYAEAV